MSRIEEALILEGGGLRGVFTCGVVDCFMDHGIRFALTVGVSAGACNGLSYMSGQRGRAKSSNIDLMEKLEEEGKITVIRPLNPVEVGRMEKDTAKLTALYNEGYLIANNLIALLKP
jgi:predicted patatin/cPLA2 family phospholipase